MHVDRHFYRHGGRVVDLYRVVEVDHHAVPGEMLQRAAIGHDRFDRSFAAGRHLGGVVVLEQFDQNFNALGRVVNDQNGRLFKEGRHEGPLGRFDYAVIQTKGNRLPGLRGHAGQTRPLLWE